MASASFADRSRVKDGGCWGRFFWRVAAYGGKRRQGRVARGMASSLRVWAGSVGRMAPDSRAARIASKRFWGKGAVAEMVMDVAIGLPLGWFKGV
jgi:hypothetical protein